MVWAIRKPPSPLLPLEDRREVICTRAWRRAHPKGSGPARAERAIESSDPADDACPSARRGPVVVMASTRSWLLSGSAYRPVAPLSVSSDQIVRGFFDSIVSL